MSFSSIPVLSLAQAHKESTKPQFLKDLREALLNVGFLYLVDTGIPQDLYDGVCKQGIDFFDLPDEEKARIDMVNEPSFLGYSKLGMEVTAQAQDWREQIDFSTPHSLRQSHDPLYYHLFGPNQWPSPSYLPNFRPALEEYMSRMSAISVSFTSLIAESIGLPSQAFNTYFDKDQQHKLKIIKYPDLATGGAGQGVGPHKDSMLTSYLLQATSHRGLQAQTLSGTWVDVPPIPGSLVVAIGQGLEAITQGVCRSTTHRVLSPESGQGARFSIPFFQGVSYDAQFETMRVPEHVLRLRDEADARAEAEAEAKEEAKAEAKAEAKPSADPNANPNANPSHPPTIADNNNKAKPQPKPQPKTKRRDDVEFTFLSGQKWKNLGEATLRNRVKSHPDVGARWYPELLADVRAGG